MNHQAEANGETNLQCLVCGHAALPRGVATGSIAFIDQDNDAEFCGADGRRHINFSSGIALTNTGQRHRKVKEVTAMQAEHFAHSAFHAIGYVFYIELAEK